MLPVLGVFTFHGLQDNFLSTKFDGFLYSQSQMDMHSIGNNLFSRNWRWIHPWLLYLLNELQVGSFKLNFVYIKDEVFCQYSLRFVSQRYKIGKHTFSIEIKVWIAENCVKSTYKTTRLRYGIYLTLLKKGYVIWKLILGLIK